MDSSDQDCSILIRWKIPGGGNEEIVAISVQKDGTIQNLGKSEKNVEFGKDEPSLRGERIDHLRAYSTAPLPLVPGPPACRTVQSRSSGWWMVQVTRRTVRLGASLMPSKRQIRLI